MQNSPVSKRVGICLIELHGVIQMGNPDNRKPIKDLYNGRIRESKKVTPAQPHGGVFA